MKVLLISANTEKINMPALPVGMACVAAAAQHAGHDVACLDLMAREDFTSTVEAAIKANAPEVIGISVRNIDDQVSTATNFMLEPVKQIVGVCRSVSRAPVVLGGAGYSIFPESALDYLGADMGIRGEGEAVFVQLLDRIAGQRKVNDTPGLYLPGGGAAIPMSHCKAPDRFPIPLPDVHLSIPDTLNRDEVWVPVQSRRGCPMNCSYCSTASIEGRIMRKHSTGRVIEMMSAFKKSGFDRFFIVDNIFNLPPSYAHELCDRIIEAGLDITWRCIVYPAPFTEALAEKMFRAGCREASLGCESGVQSILNSMNKRFSVEDVRTTSEILKKTGIRTMGFLLLGGPGETRETVIRSFQFMETLPVDAVRVTAGIRIYPNTDLHRTAISEGVVGPEQDLLYPAFYINKGLDDGWLEDIADEWTEKHPNWFR